jgi:flagellin
MIINHNLAAMNAHRHFSLKVDKMDQNLESLSSGERINRGADDAAGLAVSEKMRAQIRGLNQASRNLQDAASLVQTLEGFLKESNDVLQRIRELSVQAANGIYTKEDRSQIMVEVDEMVKELNRIHEDAKFNTLRLLDGKTLGLNSFGSQTTPNPNDTVLGPNDIDIARNINFNDMNTNTGKNGIVVQSGANTDERMFIEVSTFNTFAMGITDVPKDAAGNDLTYNVAAQQTPYDSENYNYAWREKSFYNETEVDLDSLMYLESSITPPVSGVTITFLNPVDGNRLDLTTSEMATQSIGVIDVALNKVSKERADVGGFQNRLELAREGVDNAAENLQAAESRIRDADMAKEFVEFTKYQIMSQSASSMVAQANLRAQIVLNIIGG